MTAVPQETTNSIQSELIKALEDERYQWRTVDGLVEELKRPRQAIEEALADLKQIVVRSAIPDERGRSLFTTRSHYKQTHGFGDKLLAAIADRIVVADLDKVA